MTTKNDAPDNDEDLENEDRGDEVLDEQEEQEEESEEEGEQPRDAKGKFAKKKDGEEEEAEEEEEEEEEEGKAENLPIRLNKMRDQRDRERQAREAAERRAAELEAQLRGTGKKDPPEDPVAKINEELDSLYEKVEEARADGDTKVAAQLQRKIDGLNRSLIDHATDKKTAKVATASVEETKFLALLDRVEESVPELDPSSDDYDPAAVKDVEFHIVAYERAGLTPTQALEKAVKMLHGVDVSGRRAAAKETPAEEKKDPPKKKPDPKKAVEHGKKQPPDSSKSGVNKDDTTIDVAGLSDEEFDKLPESLKAKYRGDAIA